MKKLFSFDIQRFATTTVPRHSGSDALVSTRRKLDMKDRILLLEPNKYPLTVLLGRLGKVPAIDKKIQWHVDRLIPLQTNVDDDVNNSATTIPVTEGTTGMFTPEDVVLVAETGEYLLVEEVDAQNDQIKVATRGTLGGTPAAIPKGSTLVNLGPSRLEGAAEEAAMNLSPEVNEWNMTQIFETVYGVSRTLDRMQTYGGPDLAYLRMKKGIEHAIKIEMSLWFGERAETTSSGQSRRTLRGIDKWIQTFRTNAGGTLTEAELEQFCEGAFRYGRTDQKWAFCSARVISVINQFAAGKLQTVDTDKTFGIQVTKYLSGHGQLNLVKHHLFDGVFNDRMYVLDIDDIKLRPLEDTVIDKDIQAPGSLQRKERYYTELSLELGNEEKHAVLYNVRG